MRMRVLVLLLATLACVAVWTPDATGGTVLVRAGTPVLAEPAARRHEGTPTPNDAAFAHVLEHVTPDDVARGVHALRTQGGEPDTEALGTGQLEALATHAREGREARAARDALRTRRRAAEEAWLRAAAEVLEALPPEARRALLERKSAP